MSLVVNNNLMAANTARNLNAHYGRLATSTQRLSSGLRVNSAADDAAGLAIRELQRADIAALKQGSRNANDAISLIQVADGSLAIIDEKLIRMKELAEQAATGTYDSTQRLLIESEYQQMASEITRIANATDFNGIKLLDGTLTGSHDGSGLTSTGRLKIHFGTGNDSAEDYYYLEIDECTSQALGLGDAATWQDVQQRAVRTFRDSLIRQIKEDATLDDASRAALLAEVDANVANLNMALTNATDYQEAWQFWDKNPANGFLPEGMKWPANSPLMAEYLNTQNAAYGPIDATAVLDEFLAIVDQYAPKLKDGEVIGRDAAVNGYDYDWDLDYKEPILQACQALARDYGMNEQQVRVWVMHDMQGKAGLGQGATKDAARMEATVQIVKQAMQNHADFNNAIADMCNGNIATQPDAAREAREAFWSKLDEYDRQKMLYAWGQAAIYNLANAPEGLAPDAYGIGAQPFTFSNKTILTNALGEMGQAVGHMDYAGFTIRTQEDAQMALTAIENAVVSKDKIRAYLGATQNRLENTVTNINIQAENLQAAESRISDVDVATEMTMFVRNQILTQSAVAMLSQANSLPQMALQLLS